MKMVNASFKYPGGENIFSNVNISLEKGEILSIMGPNGSGKTTLLKSIAGILKLTEGHIEENSKSLAYVPQRKKLHLSYHVSDFVTFGRYQLKPYFSKPDSQDYHIAHQMMVSLEIEELWDKKINEISGGELQMCYIAKALASHPEILLLDEPESNLDFKNQRRILNLLEELSLQGMGIVINTHYLNSAAAISHKCLLMSKEEHIYGLAEDILVEEVLERYFHVPIVKSTVVIGGREYQNFLLL